MKILGYEWDQIKAAQQGGTLKTSVPRITGKEHAITIMRDVERMNLPVHKDVVEAYRLELPEYYVLNGELWEANHK